MNEEDSMKWPSGLKLIKWKNEHITNDFISADKPEYYEVLFESLDSKSVIYKEYPNSHYMKTLQIEENIFKLVNDFDDYIVGDKYYDVLQKKELEITEIFQSYTENKVIITTSGFNEYPLDLAKKFLYVDESEVNFNVYWSNYSKKIKWRTTLCYSLGYEG